MNVFIKSAGQDFKQVRTILQTSTDNFTNKYGQSCKQVRITFESHRQGIKKRNNYSGDEEPLRFLHNQPGNIQKKVTA